MQELKRNGLAKLDMPALPTSHFLSEQKNNLPHTNNLYNEVKLVILARIQELLQKL